MKASQASLGRVFVLRLEHGEVLHECVERFAAEHGVRAAAVLALGGADEGSRLVVGPERGSARPVVPLETLLGGVHEAAGTGTIFPDDTGAPVLHLHLAAGRQTEARVGCVRRGVLVWEVLEVVLIELVDTSARRTADPRTGFDLLQP